MALCLEPWVDIIEADMFYVHQAFSGVLHVHILGLAHVGCFLWEYLLKFGWMVPSGSQVKRQSPAHPRKGSEKE